MKTTIGIAVIAAFPGLLANAADYTVSRSTEISASPEVVWQAIGDFCDIDDWHPGISSCVLKSIDGSVHRILVVDGIGEFVEKLIAYDASGLNYTYRIVSSPAPLDGYTGTIGITRGTPSTITWSSRFASEDAGMEAAVGGLYDAGFTAIGAMFPE